MLHDSALFQILDAMVEEYDERYVEDLIHAWMRTRKPHKDITV